MTDTTTDVPAEAPEPPATDVLRVSVRCIDNSTVDLHVPPASSVRQLKTAFAEASGGEQAEGELRVIFNGRVLGDGEALEAAGVKDGCCVHVTPGRGGAAPPVEESEGLDPAAELAALQAVHARLEQLAERARRAERSGRRRLVDGNDELLGSDRESPLGDNADFWLGIVLGLLLGFMAIICIQHPQVSPRLRMGIVIGSLMNMSGMLRSQSRRPGSSMPGYD